MEFHFYLEKNWSSQNRSNQTVSAGPVLCVYFGEKCNLAVADYIHTSKLFIECMQGLLISKVDSFLLEAMYISHFTLFVCFLQTTGII